MTQFLNLDSLISLTTLTAMEIVLGIDNVVFISILVGRLPEGQQARVRQIGIGLALILRLGLLASIAWIMSLTTPFFSLFSHVISGRDIILLGGGLFLMAKATHEIYAKLEGDLHEAGSISTRSNTKWIIFQILLLDIVFSLDSVITAVGMAQQFAIMVTAMVTAVGVMLWSAGAISQFIHRHPSMKILALAFLLLIGSMLVLEGTGQHINKGYIYFAMAFSLGVEFLNMRFRKRRSPVQLHERFSTNSESQT